MTCQLPMEHFNGGLGVEVQVRSQVDFREVPPSEKLNETIVAKLLSQVLGHARTSCWSGLTSSPTRRCNTSLIYKRKATLKREVDAHESSAVSLTIRFCEQNFNSANCLAES